MYIGFFMSAGVAISATSLPSMNQRMMSACQLSP